MNETEFVQRALDPRRYQLFCAVSEPRQSDSAASPVEPADRDGTCVDAAKHGAIDTLCAQIIRDAGLAKPFPDPPSALDLFRVRRAALQMTFVRLNKHTCEIVLDLPFRPKHGSQEAELLRRTRANHQELCLEVIGEFIATLHDKLLRNAAARARARCEFEFLGWDEFRSYLYEFFFGQARNYLNALRRATGSLDPVQRGRTRPVPLDETHTLVDDAADLGRLDQDSRDALLTALTWLDDEVATLSPGRPRRSLALYNAFLHAALLPELRELAPPDCNVRELAVFGWPGVAYLATAAEHGRDVLFGLTLKDLLANLPGLASEVKKSSGNTAVLITDPVAANVRLRDLAHARTRSEDQLAAIAAAVQTIESALTTFWGATAAPTDLFATGEVDTCALDNHRAHLRAVRAAFADDVDAPPNPPSAKLRVWFAAWAHELHSDYRHDQVVNFVTDTMRFLKQALTEGIAAAPTGMRAMLERLLLAPVKTNATDPEETES